MRILLLTDNFPPEVNAPASRGFDHAVEWTKMGHKVTVITCHPNFPMGKLYQGYKNSLYSVEYMKGIKVIRVWTYISANKDFFKRTLDYFSFALTSAIFGLFVKTDVIIATSPQFFTAFSGNFLSIVKRKPWIFEVRDLWPDSIVAVGSLNKKSKIYRILKRFESYFYQSSDAIVVVTDSFKNYILTKHFIHNEKIGVFKNGIIASHLKTLKTFEIDKLRTSLSINVEKKIVSYIGTHGLAHGLEFILNCANNPKIQHIHFLFIGDGAKKIELIDLKNKLKLTNVTFLDAVPKEEIQQYIELSDYALVNLKKSNEFKNVIPSKIFENVAAHKPILLGVEGESQKIIDNYGVGICYEPENQNSFIKAIEKIVELANSKKFIDGCVSLTNDFDRKKIANKMMVFIEKALD